MSLDTLKEDMHWNPHDINCGNCEAKLMDISLSSNEWIHWCPDCGTLLTANDCDPISLSDWRVPKLNELNLRGNRTSRRGI